MCLGLDYETTTIIIINDMCELYSIVRLASLRYDLLICYTTYYICNSVCMYPICLNIVLFNNRI